MVLLSFAYIDKKNIKQTISLNLGTVRLKELFCDNGDAAGAKEYIDDKLDVLDKIDTDKLVGIGGTFRAITTAVMKEIEFPLIKLHAFECNSARFVSFIHKVFNANQDELSKLGIKENRYDVIKPGAMILERVIHN